VLVVTFSFIISLVINSYTDVCILIYPIRFQILIFYYIFFDFLLIQTLFMIMNKTASSLVPS